MAGEKKSVRPCRQTLAVWTAQAGSLTEAPRMQSLWSLVCGDQCRDLAGFSISSAAEQEETGRLLLLEE